MSLHRLSLTEMSRLRARQKISASELLEAHLAQIDRTRAAVNPFTALYADQAHAEAANPRPGKLSGIPVTIKDSFDLSGEPTHCGSRFRLGHRATRDSAPAARLRAEGAIILGKTNTPEFLANYESDNHLTGRTNNPWNLERTAGGSSGGEAAAIASHCSPGGVGSDGGGSVRWPAHACGIAALKPTPGRVPATGHWPLINHPGGLLGVAGPMARSAQDLRLLFEVLAQHDPLDPFSAPVSSRNFDSRDLRVGVATQFYQVPVQPAIAEAVQKCARVLEQDLKIPIEPFMPTGLERAPNLWSFFFSDLPAASTKAFIAGRESDAHWTGTEFLDLALKRPAPSGQQVVEGLAQRDALRANVIEQMDRYPVLLWPAAGAEAFPHRERSYATASKPIRLFELTMPLTPWNLLGFPAVVIPFHISPSGMPIGIQLIGRPFEEERILDLAIRLEEARGPFPSIP